MQSAHEVIVVGAVGIDTNIYLYNSEIDFGVEANFSENLDNIGQAGGYSARGYNQLGYRTAFLGYVGEDYHGEHIRDQFQREGIGVEGIFSDPRGTKRSINFMYPDGRRKNFYDGKGSMQTKPPLEACRRIISGARLAHVSIVNWTRYLLPILRQEGLLVASDIQDVTDMEDPYRRDYIEQSDILFFSSVNFRTEIERPVNRFLDINPELKIVAGRGREGCVYADRQGIRYFPALELDDPVIDTNGAGDCLAVGFLSSFCLENYALEEAIERGQIAARYCCGLRSSSRNLITRDQLDDYFRSKKNT